MTKNNVSYQELYKIIDEFRKENNTRFDKIEEIFANHCKEANVMVKEYNDKYVARFEKVENWQDNLAGKITVVGGLIAISFNLIWDFVKEKLFK